ncbi:MAG: hypothetical protein U5O15_01645 [Candidatus Krumholzibacteriota bacterium]|nr:hypothetical protein [Candidatus Krumholzibacteriota bacterium]
MRAGSQSLCTICRCRDSYRLAHAPEKEGNIGEKYMIVSENMTFGDINRTLSDISGVKLPKLALPDFLTGEIDHDFENINQPHTVTNHRLPYRL